MSTDFILEVLVAETNWQNNRKLPNYYPQPRQSVELPWNGDPLLTAYQYTSDDADPLPAWPVGTSVVGAWDGETSLQFGETYDNGNVIGTPNFPISADWWDFINLLGNDNRSATGPLRSLHWQGHSPIRYAITDTSEYPLTDDPFTLTITRTDNTYPDWDAGTTYDTGEKVMHDGQGWASQQTLNTNHEPGQAGSGPWWAVTASGYGWIATMIEPSVSQDPITGYNIRVYPTADCTPGTQIYTSGNFSNGSGSFTTESTSNQWTPTADAVNIALIFVGGGNSQNGIIIMDVGVDEVTGQFWSHDQ
jgi:hypothetical protein